jgi:hypothetical protein
MTSKSVKQRNTRAPGCSVVRCKGINQDKMGNVRG